MMNKIIEINKEEDIKLSDFLTNKYQLSTYFHIKYSLEFIKTGVQIFYNHCLKSYNRDLENICTYLKQNLANEYHQQKINKNDLFLLSTHSYQLTKIIVNEKLLNINEYIPQSINKLHEFQNNYPKIEAPLFFSFCHTNESQLSEIVSFGANLLLPYKNKDENWNDGYNIFEYSMYCNYNETLLNLNKYLPHNEKEIRKIIKKISYIQNEEIRSLYEKKCLEILTLNNQNTKINKHKL